MTDQPKHKKTSSRVLLGQISRPHGVRGEVLIRSFCAEPADIANYGPLTDAAGKRTFTINLRGATAKGLIGRIDGVTDRTAAEALHGMELYIERALLPPSDDDEIYLEDLIGLRAIRSDDSLIGEVVAVQNFGAGDLIEVQLAQSARTEFLPLDPQFATEIDLDSGYIRIEVDEPPPDETDEDAGEMRDTPQDG